MSDSNEATPETAVEQQSSAEEQTTTEPEKSAEGDVTAETSKDEPVTFETNDKEQEEPAGLDTTKDVAIKEGEEEITAKLEQVELTDTKDEEKPAETDETKVSAAGKEEEPVAAKKPRKMYCLDPTDTVDIAVGESGIRALEPITIPQFMKRTVDKIPDGKALCWKDNKEDQWQSLTYTQYLKLIYNTAKSFLKVLYTIVM